MLFDAGFDMYIQPRINSSVAQMAFYDTKYEPVLRLLISRSALGYCSTTDVPKLLKVSKKMYQFVLIGLVLENRLLHRADIDRVAKLTDITSVRASLCHTLQLGSASLSKTLLANQMALSTSLSTLASSSEATEKND
jgi:ribosomal protein L10